MGDHTYTTPSVPPTASTGEGGASSPDASIWATYQSHTTSTRLSTNTILQSALRATYPSHHLAVTTSPLLKYAKAGHATATPRTDGPPLLRKRAYIPPTRRLKKAAILAKGEKMEEERGKLRDAVSFGVYDYVWQEEHFVMYVAEGQNGALDDPGTLFYVLKEATDGSSTEEAGQEEEEGEDRDVRTGNSATTDALLLAANKWAEQSNNEVWVFDQGFWRPDSELSADAVRDIDLDDIILEPATKEAIMRDVVGFFGAREQYARFGTPWKRGLIFHGTPGNGKTMTVKAIIKTLLMMPDPVPTLYVKTFEQQCHGPQQSVRQIFEKARRMAPCLLLFEDVDSLVKDDVRSYFLNQIDGLENNDGILMIGSTNNLDKLDPGLSNRPSRFDRKYRFKLPALEDRIRYCDWWRAKFADNPDLAMDADVSKRIAELSDGFSFAYLKETWVASLLSLVYSTSSMGTKEVSGRLPEVLENQIRILKSEMAEVGEEKQDEEKAGKKA